MGHKYTVYIKESYPNSFLNSVWFFSSCGIYLASQGDVPDQTLTIWKWKDEAMVAKKPAPASEYYNLAFTHDNYTKITSCGMLLALNYIYFTFLLLIEQFLLKYGFCKKLLLYEWNSGQLNIFVITFGWVCCCTHPKVMTNMFNCPEFHS